MTNQQEIKLFLDLEKSYNDPDSKRTIVFSTSTNDPFTNLTTEIKILMDKASKEFTDEDWALVKLKRE